MPPSPEDAFADIGRLKAMLHSSMNELFWGERALVSMYLALVSMY